MEALIPKLHLSAVKDGKLLDAEVAVEYFPVWKEPEKLVSVLLALKERLGVCRLDGVGVTMTAELSDAYQTKREGVCHILGCVKEAFAEVPIYVLNTDAKVEPIDVALKKPLGVAAANWAATGWLVAQHVQNCVVVDVGSTSTSIIPIANGKVVARGKTDLDKLHMRRAGLHRKPKNQCCSNRPINPYKKRRCRRRIRTFRIIRRCPLSLGQHCRERLYL